MPITEFQKNVIKLISQFRNPNSYVAGGVAIHRHEKSSRYSNDIDFFHDTDESVVFSFNKDFDLLTAHAYQIDIIVRQPSFIRVIVHKNNDFLKLEWVRDTAFRFFPVIEDELLGYRLSDVDLMVNKCLALANRVEVRDILDLIEQNESILSLSSACWASCGKDPGFSPEMLLDQMRRHSIIDPAQLAAELLVAPFDPKLLKKEWLKLLDITHKEIDNFPETQIGCIYLDQSGEVVKDPNKIKFDELIPHYGSIGGCWPRVV